ncbi:MAG: UbiA family prenyltransferase [Rubricoccaceae bacterium]|nr:UbiA family prenyltransferase [Rubricoccaceae bacterium]
MPLLRTAAALLRLLRPLNFALFLAGVALGALLAGGAAAFAGGVVGRVLLAMASAALIGGAANAVNDVYDLAIDRVNRPRRPLPSGLVSVRAAWALWAVLTGLGVVLGGLVSPLHGALAAGSAALLWAYSARLKRSPGWGNLAVAAVLGLAILYGGLAAHASPGAAWLGAAFAFLTTLAREVVKDIEDAAGDAAEGARTLPLRWGRRPAAAFALVLIFVTLFALPVPAFAGLGTVFLALALPVAAALLGAAWALLAADAAAPTDADAVWRTGAARASAWLKGAMVVGVVALALARLG